MTNRKREKLYIIARSFSGSLKASLAIFFLVGYLEKWYKGFVITTWKVHTQVPLSPTGTGFAL